MSAATSSRSCAISSKSAIALTREQKRKDVAGARRAVGRGARARRAGRPRRQPGDARELPQEAARRRARRQGNRDRGAGLRRHADVRDSRHARRADGRDLDRRHFRQDGRPQEDAPRHRQGFASDPDQRGIRQAARRRAAHAGIDPRGRAERHRVPRRDRQDLRARRPLRRRRVARGRAARSAAADRRHHGQHQARPGEDRPHPVHRVGRLPHRRSRPTCCPSCRAGCRSASSCAR